MIGAEGLIFHIGSAKNSTKAATVVTAATVRPAVLPEAWVVQVAHPTRPRPERAHHSPPHGLDLDEVLKELRAV